MGESVALQPRNHDIVELRSQYAHKELVPASQEGYEVAGVTFTIMSAEDILRYAEVKICNKELYVPLTNQPMPLGVLDARLGASKASGQCKTCGHSFQDCAGHWGYVALHHPVFHVGYFKHLINLLYCICKKCSKLLLNEEDKALFLQRSRRCHDPIMRRALLKRIVAKCKRESVCLDPECAAPQGMLRRVMKPSLDQFMKIILQKKIRRDGPGSVATRTTIVNEDLDGRYVRRLLQGMSATDCEILDVKMPEKLLISSLVVPPKCIRPSVTLGDAGTNEDDLTVVFSEIVDLNNMIAVQSAAGLQSSSILSNLEFLQLQCTRFINSEAPAVGPLLATKNITSPGRGICQRLKGKEGRFRGNLSGKRVDFSGRTVISPDVNCPISEVVIPAWSAKRLTFPERVCEATIDKLRAAVLRGDDWPGAAFVHKKDGGRSSLKYANRRDVAENLQYGDIVERHLWNGDIVLFNRQPSLHRLSIMAHKARVMPWRTFRFNECVCTPYNADFDGDEMNCHLPQTQEARAEAFHLMGVVNNLVTPKNGEPLVAATQDFLSGSYQLTSRDTFLTRDRFCLYCCYFTDGMAHIDLPPPTILKPVELWTGKQVINVLLRPNRACPNAMVSFEVKEREFVKPRPEEPDFMCPRDGYVVFRNSELLCGALAKTTLGNGSKKGLFFHLIRENSPQAAAACMGRVAKLAGRWFANRGMTIGIDDVTPSAKLQAAKAALLAKGYAGVENEIASYKKSEMQPNPGCTLEETLEARVKAILDDLRTIAGKAAQDALPPTNKPLIMFLSGAKGALINIAQMIALVGQQNVGGCRIQNGFVDRTLPHFKHKSQDGRARGFVAHSFYDGLDPEEFFFHTMSGREGLVDTAVKTAETGYMQRRLVKALEDLSLKYDRTVRTSDGQIVQFVYGDDGLNPTVMEDKAKPMSLEKVYHHAACLTPLQTDLSLLVCRNNDTNHTKESHEAFEILDPHHVDLVLPPPDSMRSILDVSLQYHLTNAEKRLRQQHMQTKRMLAGIAVPNDKKRQRMSEEFIPKKKVVLIENALRADTSPCFPKKVADAPVLLPLTAKPLPRSIEQKLLVMQSWKASSRLKSNVDLLEQDPTYVHARSNVLAHLAVSEWLSPIKQHAPLLPYEILAWGKYLQSMCAEPLPIPLQQHQDVCMEESPTHQALTKDVRAFSRELTLWTEAKAAEVADYREKNAMLRADTEESYRVAVSLLRATEGPSKNTVTYISGDNQQASYFQRAFPAYPMARRAWVIPDETLVLSQATSRKRRRSISVNSPSDSDDNDIVVQDEILASQSLHLEQRQVEARWKFSQHHWITVRHLLEFFRLAWRKYNRALMEPGEAVGATGAQSIGEPGTQMTLKTFHFAGVASMNVTLGVPRIKEIINAATKIMTPIIQVPIINDRDFDYALMVKSRIERTLLGEVCSSIKEVYCPEEAYLTIKLDRETISKLFLDITAESVRESILATPGLLNSRARLKEEYVEVVGQYKIVVRPPSCESLFFDLQTLKQRLQTVYLAGLKDIKRGVIKREERKRTLSTDGKSYMYGLAVEGYGLLDVMGTAGVEGTRCVSNHVMEVKDVLGIEAARRVIIDEIQSCMDAYSMDIDCRHMQLLGDVMTFRGDVLGISRFGIQKMRASTLMLASFEETNEHLFEAAAHHRQDTVRGVSECIIMGKSITLGTGAFDLLYNYKNQWTGTILDGGRAGPKTARRSTLLLSRYGQIQ